jgi:hypothetical protein
MANRYLYINPDFYVGAVKLHGVWRIFYGTLSEWILNYEDYAAPEEDLEGWRNGLLNVDENNGEEFCKYMAANEVPLSDVGLLRGEGTEKQEPLTFVVNFDDKLFINGWMDMLPIHKWAPSHWERKKTSPYSYVPDTIRSLWNK